MYLYLWDPLGLYHRGHDPFFRCAGLPRYASGPTGMGCRSPVCASFSGCMFPPGAARRCQSLKSWVPSGYVKIAIENGHLVR